MYIKHIKFFKDQLKDDQDAYDQLSNTIKIIDIPADELLFVEGSVGELFYIIISGEVQVLKASQVAI